MDSRNVMKGPVRISEIAAAHSSLRGLMDHAQKLRALELRIAERLGENFATNFGVAAIHLDGTLVLVANSPAWATRMRYIVPELLKWIQASPDLNHVRAIEINIKRVQIP
ncbi:MAG: DUF721 domain-containing protein [Gammaproteobacteria bacterium]|nr:DUF721 domain-containing protein [Gammaproteobacteria bacterium]